MLSLLTEFMKHAHFDELGMQKLQTSCAHSCMLSHKDSVLILCGPGILSQMDLKTAKEVVHVRKAAHHLFVILPSCRLQKLDLLTPKLVLHQKVSTMAPHADVTSFCWWPKLMMSSCHLLLHVAASL